MSVVFLNFGLGIKFGFVDFGFGIDLGCGKKRDRFWEWILWFGVGLKWWNLGLRGEGIFKLDWDEKWWIDWCFLLGEYWFELGDFMFCYVGLIGVFLEFLKLSWWGEMSFGNVLFLFFLIGLFFIFFWFIIVFVVIFGIGNFEIFSFLVVVWWWLFWSFVFGVVIFFDFFLFLWCKIIGGGGVGNIMDVVLWWVWGVGDVLLIFIMLFIEILGIFVCGVLDFFGLLWVVDWLSIVDCEKILLLFGILFIDIWVICGDDFENGRLGVGRVVLVVEIDEVSDEIDFCGGMVIYIGFSFLEFWMV